MSAQMMIVSVAALLWLAGLALAGEIRVDGSATHQTIDGFGAFGGRDVNWHDPERWFTDEFLDLVIDDLGLTIHRNEYYPEGDDQDTQFRAQVPLLKALKAKAEQSGELLKFFVAFWTPPARLKENASHKDGGHVLPEHYDEVGRFAVQCLQDYASIGIDVYALSLQNEPGFATFYNSCVYTPAQYRDMLKVAGPIIKERFPDVRLLGAEHMLYSYEEPAESYEGVIIADPEPEHWIDIWACHGYNKDGQTPDPESTEARLWGAARELTRPTGKPFWMTETGGYEDTWPDAEEMATAIYAALRYGDCSAWVWWQLSEAGGGMHSLMTLGEPTRRYYVARQFYRYIRPGAVRVDCETGDEELFAVAFVHPGQRTLTIVLINTADGAKSLPLKVSGPIAPEGLAVCRTSAQEDGVEAGTVASGGTVELPPHSVTTLHGTAGPAQ